MLTTIEGELVRSVNLLLMPLRCTEEILIALKTRMYRVCLPGLRMHRYSSFTAIDDVREFADRRSHGYKRVVVKRIVLNGEAVELDRAAIRHPFAEWSFGLGVLGLSVQRAKEPANAPAVCSADVSMSVSSHQATPSTSSLSPMELISIASVFSTRQKLMRVFIPLAQPFMGSKLFRKLKTKPDLFFRDAKSPLTRRLGRAFGIT